MTKLETAMLIKILYAYNGGKDWTDYLLLNDYLMRKGYFFKRSSRWSMRPTRKLYKLLQKTGVKVETLKKEQDEFDETGYVVIRDKFGFEKTL